MAVERTRTGGSELVTGQAFGEMLRRQRERRGIALRTVAEQTKIGPSLLTALERGDCSRWPGGIYSRAWIRAYAVAIGLDPEDVGAQFNRCFARNAFPEGDPAAIKLAAHPELPRITPLRMTLEPDPGERVRLVARRTLFFVADLLLSALTAAVVSLLTVVTFWTGFAVAVIACHALGLFGGGGSATGWMERAVRRHARPHEVEELAMLKAEG
jgi:transcriptional regulator with XRE-family HTH domain